MNKLKVIDLFSGIGGFSLGLHSTDIFETIKFVEFDKFCQKVLKKNFPNVPIEGDIRNVKGEEFEADVITGGFPCQPFSVAGRQKGTDDNRYLWPEMFRLIKEVKPEFVIGENVQGLVNLQNGLVLRPVQDDLEAEGFEVQCFLIPASGIGAWHRRNRVWIVGHSKTNGLLKAEHVSNTNQQRTQVSIEGQHSSIEVSGSSSKKGRIESKDVSNTDSGMRRRRGTIEQSRADKIWGFYSEEEKQTNLDLWSEIIRRNVVSGETQTLSDTNSKGPEGHGVSTELETMHDTENDITETDHDRQQTWWQTESSFCGIPDGISYELDKGRGNRIKSLGNAIVPQMARIFGLAIKRVLEAQ